MRFVCFAAVLAAALSAATAFAQMKESINVNVVEVPVTVVDGSGNAVRGLTAANFKLFDQGKERPITAFDTIDLSVKQSAMTPMNPAARRNFMLLFDLSFSTPKSMRRAPEAARRRPHRQPGQPQVRRSAAARERDEGRLAQLDVAGRRAVGEVSQRARSRQ